MTMAVYWKEEGVGIEHNDDKGRRGKSNISPIN